MWARACVLESGTEVGHEAPALRGLRRRPPFSVGDAAQNTLVVVPAPVDRHYDGIPVSRPFRTTARQQVRPV